MDKKVHSSSSYKWSQREYAETLEVYHKFVNWVSGEFDLYLQECKYFFQMDGFQ